MNELSLDETLSRVRGHTIKLFASHELLDDLLQEAAISAWKDYQDGESMGRIIMRAKYRVLGLISQKSSQHEAWTGRPSDGRSNTVYEEKAGAETRVKIREFITSYLKLHGHQPSAPEIARHLDMAVPTIRKHLERLWLFSGNSEFRVMSLDSHPSFWDGDSDERVSDLVSYGFGFEDELINNIDTFRWLRSQTDDRERTWVYLKVFKYLSAKEIAAQYGVSKSLVEQVCSRTFKRMREELNDQANR